MSTTFNTPVCQRSLKILGDYWTMMIIDNLTNGPRRFKELEQQITNVNTATLSARLKNMQLNGLIVRHEASRADVTYELTDLGKMAVPILQAVNNYSAYAQSVE